MGSLLGPLFFWSIYFRRRRAQMLWQFENDIKSVCVVDSEENSLNAGGYSWCIHLSRAVAKWNSIQRSVR